MKRLFWYLVWSLVFWGLPSAAGAGERGLLWRVVQTCVLNHSLTGGTFPCLAVETPTGTEAGYAVLRAPNEDVHVVVTPTVRTIGIEASRLRGPDAPNYFLDAWFARHFVTDNLARHPGRADIALAVNSRLGRSQDQLHIHIACVRSDVKTVLARQTSAIHSHDWIKIKPLSNAAAYAAHFQPDHDLSGINIFDRVAESLKIDAKQMDDVTIVVVGAEPTGFIILARKRIPHSFDEPHGEALLDHDCTSFQKP